MISLKKRFEAKVNIKSKKECWLWTASMDKKGYGQISVNGKAARAHRISYQLYVGNIPEGLFVLHKCDVRLCVNPNHMFLGTNLDNIKDMHKKNRGKFNHLPHPTGEAHPNTTLTEDIVRKIRKDFRPLNIMEKEYGIKKLHYVR